MSDFSEIRAILDELSGRLAKLEGLAVDLEPTAFEFDHGPTYFDSEVAFLDGAASLLAQYGARLRDRGNALTVRLLLGDLAWGIDWLLTAGALDDVDAWEAAVAWFEARAKDAPDSAPMVLPARRGDALGFVHVLELACRLGHEMIEAESSPAGLTGTKAIKVVEKVIRHRLALHLVSVVPRYNGDTVGTRQPWPVIVALADFLRAAYVRMGEPTHAGSLGQPGTPSNGPQPFSTPH